MSIVAAIIFLGIIIFIHEAGHFVAARLFGVRVITFSFGFGRRLVGIEAGGTDYRISLIPFGGYVRMAGADPFQDDEEDGDEDHGEEDEASSPPRGDGLDQKPAWQRIIVYAAGPAFNLVLPFFLFVLLLMAGEPQPAAVAGTVVDSSPVAQAGMRPGDRVVELSGTPVRTWEELVLAWQDLDPDAGPALLTTRRGEQELELSIPLPDQAPRGPQDVGIRLEVASTMVGVVSPESPAGIAGLQTGEWLLEVGGEPVENWFQVRNALLSAQGPVALQVEGQAGTRSVSLEPDDAWISEEARALLGDTAGRWGLDTATLFVASTADGSAAANAGVGSGDYLVAIGDRPVRSWYQVLTAVEATVDEEVEGEDVEGEAREVSVTVFQDGAPRRLVMQPDIIRDTDVFGRYYNRPVIGVTRLGDWAASPTVRIYYSLPDAFVRAGDETLRLVRFTFQQIGRIVTGEVSPKQSLGGPVEIMRQATRAAETGLFDVARLLGMISISVGIFNLLPVPVLDGGHLLFNVVEAIRGRPVSPVFRERAQMVGVMLLVALMLFVLVVDVNRLVGG